MNDRRVTDSFWLSEFLQSQTAQRRGLDNTPDAEALERVERILAPGMQRVRDFLRAPVHITSGYRSPAVNAAVGGARTSAHVLGLAADFVAPSFGPPVAVAKALLRHDLDLGYDQLIYEGTWVHIAWPRQGERGRGQVLTARFAGGSVSYAEGLA